MKTLLKALSVLALGLLGGRSWATSPESPLPAVETVIEWALARASKETENDQVFKDTYFFTRSKTTEYRNIRGNLTDRKEKTSRNEPSTRRNDDVRDADAGSAWTTNKVSSDTARHKREFLASTNLVKHFAFELQGREVIDGRPALIVAFKPSSRQFPVTDFKERCLSKVAGRFWVDEAEHVVVKVEARLTERIGIVGGLVGAVKKFTFSFGRERTAEGLWYTKLLTWHLELREVIVERVIDCVETKTDVRKAH